MAIVVAGIQAAGSLWLVRWLEHYRIHFGKLSPLLAPVNETSIRHVD